MAEYENPIINARKGVSRQCSKKRLNPIYQKSKNVLGKVIVILK